MQNLFGLYDYQTALSNQEKPIGFDPGGKITTTQEASIGDAMGALSQQNYDPVVADAWNTRHNSNDRVRTLHQDAIANPAYYNGTIGGLNNNANVSRGQELSDVIAGRNQIEGKSQQNVSLLATQGIQAQGGDTHGVNFLKDLQSNNLGTLQLMNRLEQTYGPSWRSNPAAMQIMQSFNNTLTQNQDISSLQALVSQGKTVNDYLSSQQWSAPSRVYHIVDQGA